MRLRFFFLLLIFLPGVVMAQNGLGGMVYLDRQPAVKATVSLDRRQVLTDSAGRFFIPGVTAGKHTLHISMIGAETYHSVLSVDSMHQELEFRLQRAVSSLDAVVITGTMKPVKKLESPIAVE